jgi:tetratricopeptide (TPR) repeat protein
MQPDKRFITWVILCFYIGVYSQKSEVYTDELAGFNHAVQLYENKDYYAAQILFKNIKNDFDDTSELKARCYYYEAFCAIKTGRDDGEFLMKEFVDKFPTSTKRNSAFLEVGNYYYANANYPYALKWYSRVNEESLFPEQKESYQFKFAYGLFATGNYTKSKSYFSPLLDSPVYGADAKYYYGYIAYKDDDFVSADKYLSESAASKNDKDIPYFLANIKFKTGKFQEAIDAGVPLYEKTNGLQKSELSKIIGESYFNLGDFENAIPYLENYEGVKGRWNNTDFYMLGYAYYKQKDYETAITWFNKIIDGKNAVSQNAYYHLAECYMRTDKKSEALNAFRNAYQMDFDQTIKQDAWLNYAKLSYEIGNPYESTPELIKAYLAKYPTDISAKDLNNILVSSYLSENDYEGALNFLSTQKNSEDYQKVAYLRGTQLFKQDSYKPAKDHFILAQKTQNEFSAQAIFWTAESDFRMGDFQNALTGYQAFLTNPDAAKTLEYKNINYHIAYCYFSLKDYNQAGGYFDQFIKTDPLDKNLLNDSYLRLGDSFFALGNYYKALIPYNSAIEGNSVDADKAAFQIALCHGLMGDNDKKINALESFLDTNLKSALRDDAFYELGNSLTAKNQTDKALKAYDDVIKNYPQSSLVPKSMLKQGLIYFNMDQNEQALAKYKTVVRDYPNTPEAIEAISNARQVYVEQGKVAEYEKMVKNIDYIDASSKEIDGAMYESAEKQYVNNNYKKAIPAFEEYVKRFPKGQNIIASKYYLASSYEKEGQTDKAKSNYKSVTEYPTNDFTENALSKLAEIYLKENKYQDALPLLTRLEKEAGSEKNRQFAQSNLMKSNYALNKFEQAEKYAEMLLDQPKLDPEIRSDAEIIIARSAFKKGDLNKARTAFEELEKTAAGELKAESIYYNGYFLNQDGNYKNSNEVIQKLASTYSNYRYWGAKGLIVMAKNYYGLSDLYQATYILESVMKNFSEYDDVVQEAKIELQKIKQEAKKTNESVIQEN